MNKISPYLNSILQSTPNNKNVKRNKEFIFKYANRWDKLSLSTTTTKKKKTSLPSKRKYNINGEC